MIPAHQLSTLSIVSWFWAGWTGFPFGVLFISRLPCGNSELGNCRGLRPLHKGEATRSSSSATWPRTDYAKEIDAAGLRTSDHDRNAKGVLHRRPCVWWWTDLDSVGDGTPTISGRTKPSHRPLSHSDQGTEHYIRLLHVGTGRHSFTVLLPRNAYRYDETIDNLRRRTKSNWKFISNIPLRRSR